MSRYWPSKSFVLTMIGLFPLLIGAGYVLNRNSPSVLSNGESASNGNNQSAQESASSNLRNSKRQRFNRDADSQRREAWFKEILARHPDMVVPSKNVPDDQNGFLKLLDFAERFKKSEAADGLEFPKELRDYMDHRGVWNSEAARAWLTQNKPLLDEVRDIGLMPDQSSHGIETDRYGFALTRLTISCADALVMEARLAAADGNVAGALESMRAANGLGDHINQIETPSFLTETITSLIRLKVQGSALTEIMQALPANTIDVAAWEAALHPTVSPPAEFSRILKGEWNVGMQQFLLPMLTKPGNLELPPNPEEFIDVHTEMFRRAINANSSLNPRDLPSFNIPPAPSSTDVSQNEVILESTKAWRKGWVRTQSVHGLIQAAFAIMKGQPVPNDPIYGLPYVWDPDTRTLSQPNDKVFDELESKPIIVPKP